MTSLGWFFVWAEAAIIAYSLISGGSDHDGS